MSRCYIVSYNCREWELKSGTLIPNLGMIVVAVSDCYSLTLRNTHSDSSIQIPREVSVAEVSTDSMLKYFIEILDSRGHGVH